jgi:hypothetical protein
MLKGGCFCGNIRYETTGVPGTSTNCHCSICQRTTGAPFVTWFRVPLSTFQLLKGQPQEFQSTEKGVRSFCPICGTQLLFVEQGKDEIDITTTSLDQPGLVPPVDHIYTDSKVPWLNLSDTLPSFAHSKTTE